MKLALTLLAVALLAPAAFSQETVTVFLAGDSTMAPKLETKRPESGWGEHLQKHFDEKRVRVENHAMNGRSTRTFINEGRWQAVVDKLKAGDYVLIQFGHNDSARDRPDRYTPPEDYRRNLERFVADVRARKATPVLLTPVVRDFVVENLRSGRSKHALDVQGFESAPIYGLRLKNCTFENVQKGSVVANLRAPSLENVRVNGRVVDKLA